MSNIIRLGGNDTFGGADMPTKQRGRPVLPANEVQTDRIGFRLDHSTRAVLDRLVAQRSGPRNPQGGGRGQSDVLRDAILAYASKDRRFSGIELRLLEQWKKNEEIGELMLRLGAECGEDRDVVEMIQSFLTAYDRAKRRVPRAKD